jgi:hypothetical protein
MTGYKSKKAAAQDKMAQNAFDEWWDSNHNLNEINPCMTDSFEYWAWEGWYAALAQPAQRPWVGLTDDEIYKIAFALEGEHWRKITDAIEAKLKEKNT